MTVIENIGDGVIGGDHLDQAPILAPMEPAKQSINTKGNGDKEEVLGESDTKSLKVIKP